jgi:tRNA(adenine34) deaminase
MQTPEHYMQRALALALEARNHGDVPVGAVVVCGGEVIAEAFNEKEAANQPCHHAEILAIERAAAKLGRWRLTDCDLYVTLEPCLMCAGAIVQARLNNVIFAARDPKAGAVVSLFNALNDVRLNHRPQVSEGILSSEASQMLKQFFKDRRRAMVQD